MRHRQRSRLRPFPARDVFIDDLLRDAERQLAIPQDFVEAEQGNTGHLKPRFIREV